MKDFLSKVFDQRGGVWVGVASTVVILMAAIEFVTSGFVAGVVGWHPKAPIWFVALPAGIYAFILGAFVISKSGTYFVDSKYNSPPETPPVKKE